MVMELGQTDIIFGYEDGKRVLRVLSYNMVVRLNDYDIVEFTSNGGKNILKILRMDRMEALRDDVSNARGEDGLDEAMIPMAAVSPNSSTRRGRGRG